MVNDLICVFENTFIWLFEIIAVIKIQSVLRTFSGGDGSLIWYGYLAKWKFNEWKNVNWYFLSNYSFLCFFFQQQKQRMVINTAVNKLHRFLKNQYLLFEPIRVLMGKVQLLFTYSEYAIFDFFCFKINGINEKRN